MPQGRISVRKRSSLPFLRTGMTSRFGAFRLSPAISTISLTGCTSAASERFRSYQNTIDDVDKVIEDNLKGFPTAVHAKAEMPERTKKRPYQRQHYEPAFNLRKELYRIFGVDLTNVPGISAVTAHTLLREIGRSPHPYRDGVRVRSRVPKLQTFGTEEPSQKSGLSELAAVSAEAGGLPRFRCSAIMRPDERCWDPFLK